MLSQKHMELLEKRGIQGETASRLSLDSSNDNLVIPYFQGDKCVGKKYRTLEGDKKFFQEGGSAQIFYNWNALRESCDEAIVICEGEMDCLIALQCGFLAVSVPNGAPMAPVTNGDKKYEYLADLPPDRTIILAVDSDNAGQNLLHDLSLRIGQHRCKWVKYPVGCKDLNDAFVAYGLRGVVESINRAQWLKIDGIYTMSELPEPPQVEAYDCPIEGTGEFYKIRGGDLTVITGVPGFGKALALDTPIPTPTGWKIMGDLQVGDRVFDETGSPCTVTFATPVMSGRPCYRMKLDDGTEIIADADHQWLTTSEKSRRSARVTKLKRGTRDYTLARGTDQRHKKTYPGVVTTGVISKTIMAQGKINHHIQFCQPVKCPKVNLPIDPYVLGVWLGDGHSACGRLTTWDQEIIWAIEQRSYKLSRSGPKNTFTILAIQPTLRGLGILNAKRIPDIYLRASVAQRTELLKGLMDTDGHCTPKGYCEFTSVKEGLTNDVYELICSLGFKAIIYTGRAMINGKDCGVKYRIVFYPTVPVFHLKSKRARQKARFQRGQNRKIVLCSPIESVPVRCIQVDSPSHLYLASRSFVPTHNTTITNEIAAAFALRYKWNVAFASFEQNPKTDHRRGLRTFYNSALVKDQEAEEIADADRWIEEKFTFIVPHADDDVSLKWTLDKCEAAILRNHCKLIIIDPWNEMDHDYPDGMSLTQYTGFAIKRFKKLAQKHLVHIIVVAHPAKLQKARESGLYPIPSLYDISDSAHWYNKPDIGIVIHKNEDKTTLFRVQKCRYINTIGNTGEVSLTYDFNRNSFSRASASLIPFEAA
jgi:hypothetical protein